MATLSRRFLLRTVALLSFAAFIAVPSAQAQTAPAVHKNRLVIQVTDNDPARWTMILNNAKNAQEDVGGADKIEIEIVAYGPGINMLKNDSAVGTRVNSDPPFFCRVP